eukprot:12916504-Alexandrium_andersonii.AAC.1
MCNAAATPFGRGQELQATESAAKHEKGRLVQRAACPPSGPILEGQMARSSLLDRAIRARSDR